jgi:hypothetical protein
LGWLQPIVVQPGDSASTHVFTVVWEKAESVAFEINLGGARSARMVR